jgi:inosine-uridine nucleoside N-ribohydrolase
MKNDQRIKNLTVPTGNVDVVLDTDAYNEIDDQFAIAYLLKNSDKLNTKAIYAAPFYAPRWNYKSNSVADGMQKSYDEIHKLLSLMNIEKEVYRGSESFLHDEKTPVISDAARDLASRADEYSPENPLYVVAIGAITNVASAVLINPRVAENCVLVWLGGNALHLDDTREFNMVQDIAASRVVMSCGMPFVQLPCSGVVDIFTVSKADLECWLVGKNPLADYLAKNTIDEAESYAHGTPWTRVVWDVTAVAWLLNVDNRFMRSRLIKTRLSDYNGIYESAECAHEMCYVYHINRDRLMKDLFDKIIGE